LREQQKQRVIRDDFFYRIYVIAIHLPPLRDRKEDIPLLVDHFLRQNTDEETPATIPGYVMEALLHYEWPGNVRELQNTLQRYLAGEDLEFIGTHQPITSFKEEGLSLRQSLEAYEKSLISRVLEQHHYHTAKTAELLDIPLTTLYRKLKKYHIQT
jgi:transcriptional regulator with PAS, ATPase and Fis domain